MVRVSRFLALKLPLLRRGHNFWKINPLIPVSGGFMQVAQSPSIFRSLILVLFGVVFLLAIGVQQSVAQTQGRITGRVDVEEILDRIFSEFCIGK